MRKRKKGTLLQEGTIRRFMKLANMEALQENYFDHYGLEEQEEEEEVEMGAEEELMELLNAAGIEVVDNEPVVQEVLKRVAKRLIREKMGVAQRRQRPPQRKRPQKRRR